MSSKTARWTCVVLALLAVLLPVAIAEACPTCKDAMGNDPGRAGLVQGYFWSILFMMSMPFLILGGLGTYFYLQVRRARRDGWGDDVRQLVAAGERSGG